MLVSINFENVASIRLQLQQFQLKVLKLIQNLSFIYGYKQENQKMISKTPA